MEKAHTHTHTTYRNYRNSHLRLLKNLFQSQQFAEQILKQTAFPEESLSMPSFSCLKSKEKSLPGKYYWEA